MNKLNSIFCILVFAFICENASSTQRLHHDFFFSGMIGKITFYEEEVRARLENMNCLVTTKIDEDVLDQVKRFVSRDKSSTLEILKRTEIYFPLIDKIFTEYNLPVELKYITIVESALQLDVRSTVGAAGIWQLMPATARVLKLTINDKIDQRLDPVLATHAAAKYFQTLYGMFGDWSLVMAAYNCGENKLKEILEDSNAKNFWEIKKYLPRQTQLFIPAFIGASYMMQFYGEHDIIPEIESITKEKITFAKIHKEVNLKDLYKKTNIDKELFTSLNPTYKKSTIPAMSSGSYVSLPDSLMVEFVDYYMFKNIKNKVMDDARMLMPGESISDHEIISFNRPFIFAPDNIALQQASDVQLAFQLISIKNIKETPKVSITTDADYKYHVVQSRESVSEIAENFKVEIEDLIAWNQIDPNQKLRSGTVVKIKN